MSRDFDAEPFVMHADDGIRLDAVHLNPRRPSGLAIVVAHGFSGTWRNPRTRHICRRLSGHAGVIGFDFRGHGRSLGRSTVGDREVLDVAAAVEQAYRRGYRKVAVVGFSMGASVAIRHAAILGRVCAVASISGPAHWYYRGTPAMRWLHHAIERRSGRLVSRLALNTRISAAGWTSVPLTPAAVAHKIAPIPLLIMHGDADRFFPLRHAYALYEAAGEPKQLWIEPGMGHAESAMTPQRVRRLADWIHHAAQLPRQP